MEDFYPTPKKLIEKMIEGVKFEEIRTILEPSAGKGDICDYLKEHTSFYRHNRGEIDVIEIEPSLQATLKGKDYNFIFDDFLKFDTLKRYDLIIANFPFSEGDRHLQKAIELQKIHGGYIVCLVNAETIKNPYTNLRKLIVEELKQYNAEIKYLKEEFSNAERKTNVEVALIRVSIEEDRKTDIILDSLKKEFIKVDENLENQIIEKDFLKSLIARFNFECKVGIKIIEEFFSLKPYISDSLKKEDSRYSYTIIKLEVKNAYETKSSYINEYIKAVRNKYWELLLRNENFRQKYTSNLLNDIETKLRELQDCDFNLFNIGELKKELGKKINVGVENTILKLFDEMSHQYTYNDDFGKNIHYYNGWKSNKAHKINKKIVMPLYGFSSYGKEKLDNWRVREKMEDIVKVFNYLSNEAPEINKLVGGEVKRANQTEYFRDLDFFFFTATFYKKGTCHIKFKDEKLLEKFNIFGSQRKGWLPPSYGKKKYKEMDKDERSVVDEFQGEEEYNKIFAEKDYYIAEFNNQKLLE